jgi:thiol-disulfide isomerase/thioredoxin
VLYFWSSTCPVSRKEYPYFARFAEEWSRHGVGVYGAVVDSAADGAKAYLEEKGGARFTHLLATEGMQDNYAVAGTPWVVVIDRKGRIAHHSFGGSQFEPHAILPNRLRRLLGESAPVSLRSAPQTLLR